VTAQGAEDRSKDKQLEVTDWYFTRKKI
jgi:hypothetical protein